MYYYYDPYNDICFKSEYHYDLEQITEEQYYSLAYN